MPGGGFSTVSIDLPADWDSLMAAKGYPALKDFYLSSTPEGNTTSNVEKVNSERKAGKVLRTDYYDMQGFRSPQPGHGVCIRRDVYSNGQAQSKKVYLKSATLIKVSERCDPNRQECDFSCSDWLFAVCWQACEHNATFPPSGAIGNSPSKTFGSSVTGIEYGPVVQPSVLCVDVQRPLPGDTGPFSRNNNEGKDKALQATFHVYTGKDCADL